MSDAEDAGEIEGLVELAEMIDPCRNVLEGRRPAAPAAQAEPAVLEVPDRPAAARQVGDEQVLEPQAIPGPPEPAVDQDNNGPRAAALGRSQLTELVPAAAVRVPSSRDRRSIAGIGPAGARLDRPSGA
jgi:hypothetical protein